MKTILNRVLSGVFLTFMISSVGCTTIHSRIESSPTGAMVYAGFSPSNMNFAGTTPLYNESSDIGPQWKSIYLRFVKQGYQDKVIFVQEPPVGEDRMVSVSLEKEPEKEIKWVKLVDGSSLMYNEETKKYNEKINLVNEIDLEKWNSYLKKYVESFSVEKRDLILRILLDSYTSYDDLEDKLFIRHHIYTKDESRAVIMLEGTIGKGHGKCQIVFWYTPQKKEYSYFNKLKFYMDDKRWEKDVKFVGYSNRKTEYCYLDLSDKDLVEALYNLSNSNKSVIRYYLNDNYYGFDLTDKEKEELVKHLKLSEYIIENKQK